MWEGYIPASTVKHLHKAAKQAKFLNLLAFQTPVLPHYPSRPGAGWARFLRIPTKKGTFGWNGHPGAWLPLHSSQLSTTKTITSHGGKVIPQTVWVLGLHSLPSLAIDQRVRASNFKVASFSPAALLVVTARNDLGHWLRWCKYCNASLHDADVAMGPSPLPRCRGQRKAFKR